jgi:hypothetical protein
LLRKTNIRANGRTRVVRYRALGAGKLLGLFTFALACISGMAGTLLALPLLAAPPASAWEYWGGDAGGQRFSPLAQITPANVGNLMRAWEFHTGDLEGRPPAVMAQTKFEATPLLVEDSLILCSPFNEVIALDPGTGSVKWRYDPKISTSQRPAARRRKRRPMEQRDGAMRILVVGAGAAGGYFGARLADAGRDVTFFARPERAERLRRDGLRVLSPQGDLDLKPRLLVAGAPTEPFDVVLLAVKAFGLERALDDFAAAVGPETMILPTLNGMRHIDLLVERFGEAPVLGGFCVVAATLDRHGRIVQPLAEWRR